MVGWCAFVEKNGDAVVRHRSNKTLTTSIGINYQGDCPANGRINEERRCGGGGALKKYIRIFKKD
jgi:hypothetical protein